MFVGGCVARVLRGGGGRLVLLLLFRIKIRIVDDVGLCTHSCFSQSCVLVWDCSDMAA